jgi:hypothetical protein
MKRFAPLLAAALLPLAACSSAVAATHSYSVTSFSRIRIAGPFDVHVRVGPGASARATGPQAAIDRLSIEQNDDTLVVKPLPGGWGGWPGSGNDKIVVDVTAPSLTQVSITGSGDVTVDRVRGDSLDLALSGAGSLDIGAIDVDRLGATMTGSGDLSLTGKARAAKALMNGTGDIKAAGLMAVDAVVSLIGSGDLAIGAQHTAKVNLSGSGDIHIAGPGVCTVTRSGSGDVNCTHYSKD